MTDFIIAYLGIMFVLTVVILSGTLAFVATKRLTTAVATSVAIILTVFQTALALSF